MLEWIKNSLGNIGMSEMVSLYFAYAISAVGVLLIGLLAYLITNRLLLRALEAFIAKSKSRFDDVLVKNKVFTQISAIVPACVIHAFAPVFPSWQTWIQRIAFSYIVIVILFTISKLLNAVEDICKNMEALKTKPIKGYFQVVKIISYIIGAIVIVSVIIERSPWLLLSGIGAATAVLLLIFQNSLLGLVASIQLSANNMVSLGDWIEMPKYGADGDVVDITLHTVKVQNWDKTITTIPTHAMVSESFKNWNAMQASGGRRIKRSINIDMASIKFCSEEMLERFGKIQYISGYLESKKAEIEEYNRKNNIDGSNIVNGRHLTNIGTFRAYAENYLRNHPRVHQGMTQLVRQLQPTEKGLPIEIYVFADDIRWGNYEAIQADIFDHLLSVVPEFDLRIYQSPTGYDFRNSRC